MVFRNIAFEGHKNNIMDYINMKYCENVSFENLKEL